MSMDSMKVIALGGCGGMGRYAVKTALGYDFVKEIVIADLDEKRGLAFAETCGPKTSFLKIDVNNRSALEQLFSDADVVMTTVGPYYRFGVPILKAAIDTGCHYIDINDDWEPTLEMLDLKTRAEKAGITAIIGLGASPGQSNMLAAKALSLLDTADELITGWGVSGDSDIGKEDASEDGPGGAGSYGAAIEHWVHQITGTIRLFQDGKYADVKPMQEVHIDYPGIGKGIAYTVGHPEPLTLPLFRPDIVQSCNVMVISPRLIEMLRALAKDVDDGQMTVSEAAQLIMAPIPDREKKRMDKDRKRTKGPRLPSLFAYAKGLKDGKEKITFILIVLIYLLS